MRKINETYFFLFSGKQGILASNSSKKHQDIAQILVALAVKNNFLNNLHVDYVDKLLAQKVSWRKGSVLNSSFI